MTCRIVPLVALAACLFVAAPASAATKFAYLGQARAPMIETDGRYAAWEDGNGVTQLFDSSTGKRSRHKRPRADCPLMNVGGGKLLWACRTYPVKIAFKNLRTRKTGKTTLAGGDVDGFAREIGAQWVKGSVTQQDGSRVDAWWRLSNGKRGVEPAGARRIDDLDSSALSVALCSPLRRVANPFYGATDQNRYARYQYDGEWGLTADGFQWMLQRCGSSKRHAVTLGLEGGDFTAGRIAWTETMTSTPSVAVLSAATRRTRRWRIKDIDPNADGAVVRTTANRIFVVTFRADVSAPPRVYTARL